MDVCRITYDTEGKGYEPPIHDFSMMSLDTWEDITDSVLSDKGYTFLLVAHRIEGADDSNIDLINEIYDYSVEHGYGFYALTSSPEDEINCGVTRLERNTLSARQMILR